MSNKTTYSLNGNQANPVNRDGITIELNFDKDAPSSKPYLSSDTFEFEGPDHKAIQDWIKAGQLGTGPGILEGMPFGMTESDNFATEQIFDGYLDLRKSRFSRIKTFAKIAENKGLDWFNSKADSFSFQRLFEETGEITEDDFVFCPYVLNSIPNYKEAAISLLTLYFIIGAIKDAIKELAELIPQIANVFEATAIVRAVIQVTFLVLLIASMIKLIKDMITLIIQPVKYHAGMMARDLFTKGCNHLGLIFKSEIFENPSPYKNMWICPGKNSLLKNPSDPRIFNLTTPDKTKQYGYYKGTFGQFVREMKEFYCAKIVIKTNQSTGNKEMHFIREDKNASIPQYTLPGIYSPDEYDEAWTYNTNECYSNYSVEFLTDTTDRNTNQDYLGTIYQATLSENISINPSLALGEGYKEVKLNYARASTKTELTVPEQIINTLVNVFNSLTNAVIAVVNSVVAVVNTITGVINQVSNTLNTIGINFNINIQPIPPVQGVNLNNLIDNRIGMMVLEDDSFLTQKVAILNVANNPKNTKIHPLNGTYLSAEYIYKAFHYVRSWLPSLEFPFGYQRKLLSLQNIPFVFSDWLKVKDCNKIFDVAGNEIEVVSLKWNEYNQLADFELRIPELVTSNIKQTEQIPNGQ